MLERSAAYDAAIVGSPRDIYLRAVVDISDPDTVFGAVGGSPEAPWSKPAQLHDKVFDTPPRYATLEPGRWLLDGSFDLFPDSLRVSGPVGDVKATLSGPDGVFATPQVVTQAISGASILQACSLFFSPDAADGVPEDFTVEVLQGGTAYYTKEVAGNHDTQMAFKGFTVYDPELIRLTVTRWTLPGRRCRLVELVPGAYEDWDGGMLERFSVTQQGQFSCLTLPYGTAEISFDNADRRFEPRRKDGLFQSVEARQGVELYLGVGIPGGVEWKMLGVYYQAGDGRKTGDNAMTMRWSLVDIVGLLAERTFLPPSHLPTTLGGWMQAVAEQLGPAFLTRYHVGAGYYNKSVTANDPADVRDKKCGDIIRWACQASGTWPRADNRTGHLTADPLWSQGGKGGSVGGDGYIWRTGNLGGGMEAGEGEPGLDGQGGAVWYGVINCNEEQEFDVRLGGGGAPSDTFGVPGGMGGHTTFGAYSSEDGQLYPGGYTDIANGQTFARAGVPSPLPGTGDGGKGGAGGEPGVGYIRWVPRNFGGGEKAELRVISPGGPGKPGAWGATGFAMVTWEKPGGELTV